MAIGRPRTFDPDEAVAAVLPIFIEKGFEGATFGQLIATMGLNPPSFYAAFRSKEQLFQRVIELYAARCASILEDALAQPTAYEVIERLLRATAEAVTDQTRPAGCLFVQGALACSDKATDIKADLATRRTAIEPVLAERLRAAQADGDDSIPGDAAKVAVFVSAVISGLAVRATSAGQSTLQDVVDVTLDGLRAR
jgi:AcrR family transcriptional regulator